MAKSKESYAVGYGRPTTSTQFKAGQVGQSEGASEGQPQPRNVAAARATGNMHRRARETLQATWSSTFSTVKE